MCGRSNNPSLCVMERRVEALVKSRVMAILLNISKRNVSIGKEQYVRAIEGLNGKAEMEAKATSAIQETRKLRAEKDLQRLREDLFSAPQITLSMIDKKINARVVGAIVASERLALRKRAKRAALKTEHELNLPLLLNKNTTEGQAYRLEALKCLERWQISSLSP